MFGKKPTLAIQRDDLISEVVTSFSGSNPSTQLFIFIGARGAGKTVLLTELYKYYEQKKDWIVVDVNPHRDILEEMASQIYEKGKLKNLFLHGTFDFSFHGLSFHLEGKNPVSSVFSIVEKMLSYLKKHGMKLLLTLDEVNKSKEIKAFAHDFQSLVRLDYPIYLLMTGLYENVSSLQNDKSLTFLYRSPKILLSPLDKKSIKKSYQDVLSVNEDTANRLAELSMGYGFGYQLLGYLYYNFREVDDKLLFEYDRALRVNAYDKIYAGLSENERKILNFLCKNKETKISNLMAETGFDNKNVSVYRERLLMKGVITSPKRGCLSLALPRFKEFLEEMN